MILHIDMDAFYASVEILDNPALKGKPVIVAGLSSRGVVCAASYEARKYGVSSAMPVFEARKKCPHAIVVPTRKKRYKEISAQIMAILYKFSPLVEKMSIDEAYLDVTGCERLFGTSETIAQKIKKRIFESTHLTCSVGVATAKFLSKIASDMDKPDGLVVIRAEDVSDFVENLCVEKVPGVGNQMAKTLFKMGIRTLGDVRKYPKKRLIEIIGKNGHRLSRLAEGYDSSGVYPNMPPKSVSAEETFDMDTADKEFLKKHLLIHAVEVSRQLRKLGTKSRKVTIKIKHADFTQVTRSITLKIPTSSERIFYREACRILDSYYLPQKVRLIGLGASGLIWGRKPLQLDLFQSGDSENSNWEKVDKTLDLIVDRFGKKVISKAALKAP